MGNEEKYMDYEGDKRSVTMEELEQILTDIFGDSAYDRQSGCSHNGSWFSIDSVLSTISACI